MIGAELPGVFVNVMRAGPGLGNVGPGAGRPEARLPRPGPRQHAGGGPGPGHAAGDARPHHARLRAHLPVPQPGGGPRRRLPRPDDREGEPAVAGRPARAPVLGGRRRRGPPPEPRHLHPARAGRPGGAQRPPHRQVRAHGRRAARRDLPLRGRRGAAGRLQHPGAARPRCGGASSATRGSPRGCSAPRPSGPSRSGRSCRSSEQTRRIVVVEASPGQLEDELRLALSHAGAGAGIELRHVRRGGGVLPSQREIVDAVRASCAKEARA